MAEQKDMLTGLDALVARAGHHEQELRDYLSATSERLRTVCSRADLYCRGEQLVLEECGDGEHVFGYLACSTNGLYLAHAFTGDVLYLNPGESIDYTIIEAKDSPLPFLRAICSREVIEAFLMRVQEEVLRRTDELRSRVVDLATLAMPPDHAAAADTQRLAEKLGFGGIAGDWRAAQVKAITDPSTAVRSACTLVESVCKHVLEARGVKPEGDLAGLLKATRKTLGLDADAGVDKPLQRLVSGLGNAVSAIGTLRNLASDAHGKGAAPLVVSSAQAKLAVNAAGVIVTYLLDRLEAVKAGGK
jgi:hypothetical protein